MRSPFFILIVPSVLLAASPTSQTPVTFYKEVLPVLQKNCQGCHRPGEAAPMSFVTYEETRPWAKAMKQAALTRKMPPWFADPHVGKFANDRTLSQADIDILANWADTGAIAGDANRAPKPVAWVEGWQIGEPDTVFEMPSAFNIPAKGTIEYQYIVIPTGFKEDRWVQGAEARPGNRALVHHILAFIREPGSKWLRDAVPGVPYVPAAHKESGNQGGGGMPDDTIAGFAPGVPASLLAPGQARLMKAGSDIVLQMHYTASGTAATDQSKVGIVWAKQPPKERVLTLAAGTTKFAIPPGDPDYKVDAQITLAAESTLVAMLPHMHLRGKAFTFRLVKPDGTTEELLSVPHYDFSWQLWYQPLETKVLRAGSKIECSAWYDNSANNAANPDPKAEVKFGEQSWEEMMFGFFDVAVNANMDKRDLFPKKGPTSAQAQPRSSE
jgi:hypothetical protein